MMTSFTGLARSVFVMRAEPILTHAEADGLLGTLTKGQLDVLDSYYALLPAMDICSLEGFDDYDLEAHDDLYDLYLSGPSDCPDFSDLPEGECIDLDYLDARTQSFAELLRHCAQASDPEAFAAKHREIKLLPYGLKNRTKETRSLHAYVFSPFYIECAIQALHVGDLAAAYVMRDYRELIIKNKNNS